MEETTGKFGWIAVTAGIVIAVGIAAKAFFPKFFNEMTGQIKKFFTDAIDNATKDAAK